MRKFTFDTWNLVMSAKHNPLKHIPDNNVRHMIMQILAWMWAIIFSFWMGSLWIFGFTAVAHAVIIAGIAITVTTFEVAKRKPNAYSN